MNSITRSDSIAVLCVLASAVLQSATAHAVTRTIPAGTGTLTFNQSHTSKQIKCAEGGTGTIQTWTNSGFSYKNSAGNITSLAGFVGSSSNSCDGSETGNSRLLTSTMLDLNYDTVNNIPDGEVTGFQPHGYINPKYAILSVMYTPPGHLSYAQYAHNSTVSSTFDVKDTFGSAYQLMIQTKVGGTIFGWGAGNTSTSTTDYSQNSYTSSSNTVSQSTGLSKTEPGASDDFHVLNHDYDVIWVWLNPVQTFRLIDDTAYTTKNIEYDGVGYSTLDPVNGMDVIALDVGWLNGDIPMPSNIQQTLARTWAGGEVWPSGQGPGLTSSDLQAIAQADPFWQCTPHPSSCPTSADLVRYTQSLNQDIVYEQAPVGGQPITESYTDSYTQASTAGQGASYEFSQTFANETTFSGSLFLGQFSVTLKVSTSFSSKHEWDRSLTNTNTQSATVSVTGPAAPPPTYTGSTQFDVYEDNLYGTFMLFPVN